MKHIPAILFIIGAMFYAAYSIEPNYYVKIIANVLWTSGILLFILRALINTKD